MYTQAELGILWKDPTALRVALEKIDLGLWEPHIARSRLGELLIWRGFKNLINTLLNYQPDGHELDPLPPAKFEKALTKGFKASAKSVANIATGFHGSPHFRRFVYNGLHVISQHQGIGPEEEPVLGAPEQEFLLAGVSHDERHPGCTFRSDNYGGLAALALPKLRYDVSVEWVTAVVVDRRNRKAGLNPLKRLFRVLTILATTYGEHEPRGIELGLCRFQPVTLWDWSARVVDAVSIEPFVGGAEEDVEAMFGPIPPRRPPNTWKKFYAARRAYFDYIEAQMDGLDHVAGRSLTGLLRERIRARREIYERMERGQAPVEKAILQDILRSHGIRLR